MSSYVLFKDYDGLEFTVNLPLNSCIDVGQVRKELDIPDYVDTGNFLMERGLVTIWAGLNAHKLQELYPNLVLKGFGKEPVPVLFFGGAAIRMLCPSSNDPSSPLYRELNDVDLITTKRRAQDLYNLLLKLGELFGTRYHHFVTRSDRRFNALRGGKRYRVRTIDKILKDGTPVVGFLDILTDSIDLRHKVDVRDIFDDIKKALYTISLENTLLTKCQYIFHFPKSLLPRVSEEGLDYRILNCPYFRHDRIVMGMEEKDIKDVCAILNDHDVGEGEGEVSPSRICRVLKGDKKFALTFRLNLQNIAEKQFILRRMGLTDRMISRIIDKINALLDAVPVVDKKWTNPWWNVDVVTPQIFGKTARP